MQVLNEPRLETETEDTHLLRTFVISSKPNQANWATSKLEDWEGKDFVMIPEKIFDLNEKQPGHTSGTFEEQMAEIKRHSQGKIVKMLGPFNYDDGTDDVKYKAIVKLNNSKAAAAIIENGKNTWTKFAVSPQIWPLEGTDDNITKYIPMGLFMVIKGAYGDEAVIEKMCSGSKLKCGTALSAAILNLNHETTDEHLGEILTSYIKLSDDNKHKMSAQVQELKKEVNELPDPVTKQVAKVEVPKQEEPKIEEPKQNLITLTHDEFESYKKEREEHKQLVLENKTNKLNSLFNVVEDADKRNDLVKKYIDKDVNLLIQYHNDVVPYVEKFVKGKEVKVEEPKDKSKSGSILKDEPKKETDDSKSAAVVPNKVNEVLVISKMFAGEVL